MAADDYPYKGQSGIDPWGFYMGYCTSFAAWRMNRNAGDGSFTNFMDGGRFSDAGNWGANAQKLGIPVNTTPAVGAIAWWGYGTISTLGHVGYVEAVNADGTIIIEDYNYSVRLGYTRRIVSLSDTRARPTGYIHFHDLPEPDTIAPVITLACVEDGATYAGPVTPSFSAADTALKSVTATLNGVPFATCSTIAEEGAYTLTVTAVDTSGNTSAETVAFTIDFEAEDPHVAFTTIAGADRYETTVKTSQTAFESASTVVIATGENWPDALGGAALAGAKDGPILLTRAASLPPTVLAEIRRLGASEAIILGGEGAVSPAVEQALAAELGGNAVSRIGGATRYETAELVARATRDALGGSYSGMCFVATGESFPDSLAASPLAAAQGWPLVLTEPGALAPSARQAMEEIGVSGAVVLGGAGVVAESVESTLAAWLGDDAVERISGVDRYETAAEVADFAVAQGLCWDGAAIATGLDFPDALAGGVLQGRAGSVLLLTRGTTLVAPVRDRLAAECGDVRSLRYLGGDGAVSCAVKA
ncbi:MAG: cell wall-binding repeat-containing protein, partial [Coriobacteriia bacterium]|nr:cell wall-binding repeat-containing protein [Coriobacteriia bacterium]